MKKVKKGGMCSINVEIIHLFKSLVRQSEWKISLWDIGMNAKIILKLFINWGMTFCEAVNWIPLAYSLV
jgi:hypothetical protein